MGWMITPDDNGAGIAEYDVKTNSRDQLHLATSAMLADFSFRA
jgi:hypothetical protein